ncbi:MAG: SRPBCC family protein [Actinomycetes bacterium]
MAEGIVHREQLVPLPVDETFAFFADAFNLEAITPSWLCFRVLTPAPIVMGVGALIDYRLALHRVPVRWRTRIAAWEPGKRFVDVQLSGPFTAWEHTHTFTPTEGGTLIRDVVRYRVPFGPLGEIARRILVRRDVERIFDHRVVAVERLLGRAPNDRSPAG